MSKSVKGRVLSIGAPSFIGMLDIFSYRKWEIKFRCGECNSISIVDHDEINNYHKCPVCKQNNILDKTSYYDI